MKVTYVTSEQVYFNAGREEGVASGDTVSVYHDASRIGNALVSIVAAHTCVARILFADSVFRAGDIGVTAHGTVPASPARLPDSSTTLGRESRHEPSSEYLPNPPIENIFRGRIAFGYIGEIAADSRLNLQEPSLAATLSFGNLWGTGMMFSMNGRAVNDLTNAYPQFGAGGKSRINLYDLRLSLDRPIDHVGFTVGRMVSSYVGSLGLLDGGQLVVREAGVVAGAVTGRGITESALGIEGGQLKSAFFLGYRKSDNDLHEYEGTIAYARETLHGNLDRQFMAFQGSAFLGPSFQAFGNAEVELNGIQNGQRTSTSSLSDASLFINYYRWLSASASYDETRSVYLFETMKSIPDSLFNEAVQHGLRVSVTTRLSKDVAVTGTAGYRFRKGDPQPSHTLSGSLRAYDIIGTGFNATLRYTNAMGPYLTGNDATIELDQTLFGHLDCTLRYDHYAFGVEALHQVYLTQTISLDTQYGFSRRFYGIVRGDYVLDNTMNSVRFQIEVGMWLW